MDRRIILSSNSPRRKELLAGLGIDFEVRVIPGIDESYPEGLPVLEVAPYIALRKAEAYRDSIGEGEVVITADTVVVLDGKVIEKPESLDDAKRMLATLSGRTHQVVTGVCLTARDRQRRFSVVTDVTFATLGKDEIDHYVDTYRPLDKAGAYGIQEWIGFIGVTSINGSYFNVMGLPVQRIYRELKDF